MLRVDFAVNHTLEPRDQVMTTNAPCCLDLTQGCPHAISVAEQQAAVGADTLTTPWHWCARRRVHPATFSSSRGGRKRRVRAHVRARVRACVRARVRARARARARVRAR
eukprot:2913874-Pleurochrysis_carterae.AAC.2